MKLVIRAGGIIRKGAEREMIDDYLKRANGLTRRVGFQSVEEQQIDLRSCKTRKAETESLLDVSDTRFVVLDERGKSLTSRKLATQLARWRDEGIPQTTFLIGAADGFEPGSLPKNAILWSFGHQTWPHKLVRVMLAEQVYRSLSILAKTPYHRD